MKKQMGAYVSLAAAMAIVGSSVVVGKLMVERIPVFLSSGLRFLLASIVLLTLLFCIEKGFPALTKKDVFVLLVQSFTGVFLFSICLLYGVQLTTGTESGILTSTTPMVIGILSFFLLREKIEKKTLIGILLAVCGVLTINLFGAGSQDGTPNALFGNMLIIAAVIGEALFTLLAKLLSRMFRHWQFRPSYRSSASCFFSRLLCLRPLHLISACRLFWIGRMCCITRFL